MKICSNSMKCTDRHVYSACFDDDIPKRYLCKIIIFCYNNNPHWPKKSWSLFKCIQWFTYYRSLSKSCNQSWCGPWQRAFLVYFNHEQCSIPWRMWSSVTWAPSQFDMNELNHFPSPYWPKIYLNRPCLSK